MDELPDELLEKVLSLMTNVGKDDVLSCRLVNHRWNQVAVKFWRRHKDTRPLLKSKGSINKFVRDMDSCIQEFPFSRFAFFNLANRELEAVRSLLSKYANYIKDIAVSYEEDEDAEREVIRKKQKTLVSFLQSLDVSLMPDLKELFLDYNWGRFSELNFELPVINLSNLSVLELPNSLVPLEKLSEFIVESAPNLKLLVMDLPFPALLGRGIPPGWPFFDEKYKRIPIIEMTVKADTLGAVSVNVLDLLKHLAQKLDEWKNIHVTALQIEARASRCSDVLLARDLFQRIIDGQANYLKQLRLNIWSSIFVHHVTLPIMPKMEDLELNFELHNDVVGPIVGNPFPCLESVDIQFFREPCSVFRSAVLDTVRIFEFHDAGTSLSDFTPWHTIFPNLESFTYHSAGADSGCVNTSLNFAQVEYLITHLHMKSLSELTLKVGHQIKEKGKSATRNRGLKEIFSGLDNFKEVIRGAEEAREKGDDGGEDAYWGALESQRRPCLVNMPGLQNFCLDYPVDDDIARSVFLKMKPMRLDFRSNKGELSAKMLKKLQDHHGPS